MDNFNFYNPTRVLFGPGVVKNAGTESSKIGKKALVVSYKELGALSGVVKQVKGMLEDAGVQCIDYFEVSPNPLLSQAEKGVDIAKSNAVDMVLAIGGGSAMDTAKIIAAGYYYNHNLWKMIVSRHDQNVMIPPEKALPTIMVPTLPATSSEMNCGAVITNEKTREKSYVFSEVLFPALSIIDPELTLSLPAKQTAYGIADAISHAMETYLNTDENSPLQQRMAEGVIITLMSVGRSVLNNLENLNLRTILQWSASVAWNGWTNTGANHGAPMHQFGHVISAYNNVAHGATLSIIMPAWMKYTYKMNLKRYVEMGQNIFKLDVKNRSDEEIALEAIALFESFLEEIDVPTRLSQVSIFEDSLEKFTDKVVQVSCLENESLDSLHIIKRKDIFYIYKLAL